jgi:hypothetical protein
MSLIVSPNSQESEKGLEYLCVDGCHVPKAAHFWSETCDGSFDLESVEAIG